MSKDQKDTYIITVETVDNWKKMLDYCTSTLEFWNKNNEWPTNLINDGLKTIIADIEIIQGWKFP